MDNGESHASEHIDGKATRQTNATVHTRRPSWYRIILACLALAAILLTCSQLVGTQSDTAGYAYCVGLQLLLMLLVPIWPVPCSVALICCNGVFMAVGVFTGAWQWGGLLAIATLGTSRSCWGSCWKPSPGRLLAERCPPGFYWCIARVIARVGDCLILQRCGSRRSALLAPRCSAQCLLR